MKWNYGIEKKSFLAQPYKACNIIQVSLTIRSGYVKFEQTNTKAKNKTCVFSNVDLQIVKTANNEGCSHVKKTLAPAFI